MTDNKDCLIPYGNGTIDQVFRRAVNDGYLSTASSRQLEDTTVKTYPDDNRDIKLRSYMVKRRGIGGQQPTAIQICDLTVTPVPLDKVLQGRLGVEIRNSSLAILNENNVVEGLSRRNIYDSSVDVLYSTKDLEIYDVPGRLPIDLIDKHLNPAMQGQITLDYDTASTSNMPLISTGDVVRVGEIPTTEIRGSIIAAMKEKFEALTSNRFRYHPSKEEMGNRCCSAINCAICGQLDSSWERASNLGMVYSGASNWYQTGSAVNSPANRVTHEREHLARDLIPILELAYAVCALSMTESADAQLRRQRQRRRLNCTDE